MVAPGLFLSLLVGAAWIWLIIRLDTHRREKNSQAMLLKFFLAGFLSLIPTAILYFLSYAFWGNFLQGGWLSAFIGELFITGPVEEFSKFIVFLLLCRKMKSIKEPMDGVLQAGAVALAFATAENFLYTQSTGLWILPWRAVLATSGHLLYASIWGYIYGAIVYESSGRKLRSEYKAIFAAVLPASILHGLYNFMLDLGRLETALLIDLGALIVAVAIYRFLRERSPYNPLSGRKPRQAVVRILNGETDRGAELMEEAYPRLSKEARRALLKNLRRVVSGGGQTTSMPHVFRPEHALTCGLFERIDDLGAVAPRRTSRRVQLSRRRYLAKAG